VATADIRLADTDDSVILAVLFSGVIYRLACAAAGSSLCVSLYGVVKTSAWLGGGAGRYAANEAAW